MLLAVARAVVLTAALVTSVTGTFAQKNGTPPEIGTPVILFDNGLSRVTEEDGIPSFGFGFPFPKNQYFQKDLYLRIDFPNAKWRFGLRNDGLKGLSVIDVSLQAGQFTGPRYVIKHAGLAEIFVPYHGGDFQPYDMRFGFDNLDEIDLDDLPAGSAKSLVYLRSNGQGTGGWWTRNSVPKVGVEYRDGGLAWLCKQGTNRIRARLNEVAVWAVYDGGNYDNIIEYIFREDGSIGLRYGATGYVNPGALTEAHMHNALWRVSTKLFGQTDSEALEFQHLSSTGTTAEDLENPISFEKSIIFEPLQFTSVIVRSKTQKNRYGNAMGYEFVPWNRTGTARHSMNPSDQQSWTLADFYVTNDRLGEDGTGTGKNRWRFDWFSPDDYLSRYAGIAQGSVPEMIGAPSTDGIVVWYISSTHHEPSDLDNPKTGSVRAGVTPMHWAGLDIHPHNLFDYNPVGGPVRCGR